MGKYVALLRGINVGGRKIIKMESLRQLMEKSGFSNVSTFIQSGNIIFESDGARKNISKQIADLIRESYGFDVDVIVLVKSDIKKAIENNPFINDTDDIKKLYVGFLFETPTAENLLKFKSSSFAPDEAEIHNDIIYLRYQTSAGTSKLSNALIENKLKVTATVRNWNTTLKLLELISA